MRDALCLINSPLFSHFNSDESPPPQKWHLPGKWHLPRKWVPWIHICQYKYDLYFVYINGKQGVIMCADIKSLQAFLYSKCWKHLKEISKFWKSQAEAYNKGPIRVLIWTVKTNMTMVSSPQILTLWCTRRKNKVGIIMWLGVLGTVCYGTNTNISLALQYKIRHND